MPTALRVMTWNIAATLPSDPSGIANIIDEIDADVVAIQEMCTVHLASVMNGLRSVGWHNPPQGTGTIDFYHGITKPGRCGSQGSFGNAIITRKSSGGRVTQPLTSRSEEPRLVLRATINLPVGPLWFYSTHLDQVPPPPPNTTNYPLLQLQESLAFCDAGWSAASRRIVGGDSTIHTTIRI